MVWITYTTHLVCCRVLANVYTVDNYKGKNVSQLNPCNSVLDRKFEFYVFVF